MTASAGRLRRRSDVSRIGSKPIAVPRGVEVEIEGNLVQVKGPLGTLSCPVTGVHVTREDGTIRVHPDESHPKHRAMWGLMRTLVANMVTGVSTGFTRTLVISGTGYKAEAGDGFVTLYVGYSNPVRFELPQGVSATVEEKQTRIVLKGISNEVLGDTAARLRRVRPVEPYRAKGISYLGEKVRRKEGKSGAGKGGK